MTPDDIKNPRQHQASGDGNTIGDVDEPGDRCGYRAGLFDTAMQGALPLVPSQPVSGARRAANDLKDISPITRITR